MKSELMIDGVPAADIARRALAHGWARMPVAEATHVVTGQERAELKRETDRAFQNHLNAKNAARKEKVKACLLAMKAKRTAGRSQNITRPDHAGPMP